MKIGAGWLFVFEEEGECMSLKTLAASYVYNRIPLADRIRVFRLLGMVKKKFFKSREKYKKWGIN